ncbi:MAG: glycosyltransferase family 4 protein [Alphaproteobacteria bacterium]|nr:glycosyltransferase family 4 protein [Alphaproteobacteria bacterium]
MSIEANSTVVLHFIPQDGIGGAEIAARSATIDPGHSAHVHAMYKGLYTGASAISNDRLTGSPAHTVWSCRSLKDAVSRVRQVNPDVIVFSLWRTFGAFLVTKVRFPQRKFVTFIHNERTSNLVDRVISHLMMAASDAIWVDSQATLDSRLGTPHLRAKGRVISLILMRPRAIAKSSSAPKFVYWGRLARQKRLDRSIDLFAAVARHRQDARFTLIGPDHGELSALKQQAARLGVADRVTFRGPGGREAIAREAEDASFFLQLSDHEGMAMGVVEALQLGLVPVVTPVGQMASYCRDGVNALIYDEPEAAAQRIRELLDNPSAFAAMSAAAIATFAGMPTYSEDVSRAARDLASV